MPGSSTVDVKKKCRLGGLGNTSAACNQGDISNLNLKKINENAVIDFPDGDIGSSFNSYEIKDGGNVVGVIELMNRNNQ
jgi:hypothetical protein